MRIAPSGAGFGLNTNCPRRPRVGQSRPVAGPAPGQEQRGERQRGRSGLATLVATSIAVAALATSVAACEPAREPEAPTPVRGGTLVLNFEGGLDTLDPQRTYLNSSMNVLRLMNRTLTTYRSAPGQEGSEVIGDLATDVGRPSEGNTVWKFTLKPGLRWEGGEPVTCEQVKYGIERRFSTLEWDENGSTASFQSGAPYPKTYLLDNETPYEGPWSGDNNGGKGLESITCEDDNNIIFRLRQPVGDFGYALALVTFAPVPPEEDTITQYGERPYSNGPYRIESYTAERLTLVRNPFWSESNDQARQAYPDRIEINFRDDPSGAFTNELIEDAGDARNTVMVNSNVAPNFLQQVLNDEALLSRTIIGPTGAVRYLAINTRKMPNEACRRALIYAFNWRKWRSVSGGAVTGDYATSVIPPGVNGHREFDLYGTLDNPEGDPEKATEIMDAQASAGSACPTKIKAAFPDVPARRRLMQTVVEAYQRVGIEVDLVGLEPSTYYTTGVGNPDNDYELILAGWIPDWPSASSVIPPLFYGPGITSSGNIEVSNLDDSEINAGIDQALGETDARVAAALWGDLDQKIQERAAIVPLLYEKAILLTGSNVLGGFIHPAFAQPDLAALGLAQL